MPFGPSPAPVHFAGDMSCSPTSSALARFVTVLSALDTGSSFEGMGAAREVTFSVLAEPALFLGFAALARHCSLHLSGTMLAVAGRLRLSRARARWS